MADSEIHRTAVEGTVTGMAEYIEKEAVLDALLKLPPKMDEQGYGWLGRRGVWQMVSDFPAASVRENVTGRWIWDDEGYHCSECLYHAYGNTGEVLTGQFIYCPWCGAKLCEEED